MLGGRQDWGLRIPRLISAPLSTLSAPGMVLAGLGRGASWLKPSAGFSGAQMGSLTADLCGVLGCRRKEAATLLEQVGTGRDDAAGFRIWARR